LTTPLQQTQVVGHLVFELGPGHDRVDVTEGQVALGAAEVVGELLARGLGDHSRPREVQQRAGFGHADVGQADEARHDAAGAGVGHHGHERHAGVV
jgi:hypothetical protein